jgi:predicted nucleic acid-binding protein
MRYAATLRLSSSRTPAGLASIRDPADRWVFATAVAGQADVLVTGGQDLPAVREESSLLILEPRAFWELLRTVQE